MEYWVPERLIRKEFVKIPAPLADSAKAAAGYAISNLSGELTDAELNKIRFSAPALLMTNFDVALTLPEDPADRAAFAEAAGKMMQLTLAWDIGRFGIQVVASPRHADALLVTGPVSDNMRIALEKSYKAMPKPSFVIAGGACAISGGLYAQGTTAGGVDTILPVDMYVPGCPPHPAVMLEALIRLISGKCGKPVNSKVE